ncbi:MAG: hypothetical protein FD178_3697 [Ignavibacteria bacterium]|nr:MAG: hypothetical protein FD178_3697 [Ignavibacteria bacterium]
MRKKNNIDEWRTVKTSSIIKSSLGLFVTFSIIWIMFWSKFLPDYIFIPSLIGYIFFISNWFRIIFKIDKKLNIDKSFKTIMLNENKTIKRFTLYFFYMVISSFILLFAIIQLDANFEFKMRIFSFTTMVAVFSYLISYSVYYKYYFIKNIK